MIIDAYLAGFKQAIVEGRVRFDDPTDDNTMARLKEFLQCGADSRQVDTRARTHGAPPNARSIKGAVIPYEQRARREGAPSGKAGEMVSRSLLRGRLHSLDPEAYLRDLFRVLAHWPKGRYLELAPKYWAATRARLDPRQLAFEIGPLIVPMPPRAVTEEQPATNGAR